MIWNRLILILAGFGEIFGLGRFRPARMGLKLKFWNVGFMGVKLFGNKSGIQENHKKL